MCCPDCTEARFPTKNSDKQDPREREVKTDKGKRKKCICNTIDKEKFMIRCDRCITWYHGDCVGVKEGEYKRGDKYKCTECRKTQNPGEESDNEKDKKKKDETDEKNEDKVTMMNTMKVALLKQSEEMEVL